MGDMNFDSDVTFKESAEARINKYNKKAEHAKATRDAFKAAERAVGYGSFMEIPEFKL